MFSSSILAILLLLSSAVVFNALEGSHDGLGSGGYTLQKGNQCESTAFASTSDFDIELKLSRGKELLDSMMEESQHSKCMRIAMNELTKGCKSSSDIEFSKFAVQLTNCHLEKSGIDTIPCTNGMTLKDCTKQMPGIHFQTYTLFYTHTETICYYIMNEVLQQRTTNAVRALYESAQDAAHNLNVLGETSSTMAGQVSEALKSQNELIAKSDGLQESLVSLRKEHKIHSFKTIQEFESIDRKTVGLGESLGQSIELENELLELQKNQTEAVRLAQSAVDDILVKFEEIKTINDALVSEMYATKSIGFYVILSVLVYLMTSSPRCSNARPLLLLLTIGACGIEYYSQIPYQTLRWGITILNTLIVIYYYFSFVDYSELAYKSLRSLDRRYENEMKQKDMVLEQLESIRGLACDILALHDDTDSTTDQNGKPIRRNRRKKLN